MNRLILLGNGFDLAHGLPTSYEDFIFNYAKDEILEYLHTGKSGNFLNLKFVGKNYSRLHKNILYRHVKKINKSHKSELIGVLKNEVQFDVKIGHSNTFAFNLLSKTMAAIGQTLNPTFT